MRVGIVGHTGRGHYGHYLDMAFVGVEGAEIVALADPDEEGRAAAVAKTGAPKGYANYIEMLETEKPDIAVLASREIGDHLDLVLNCVERGVHVYLEKPVAASVAQVDQMIAARDKAGVQVVVAHPWRGHPPIQQVAIPAIKGGKIGAPRLCQIYGMGGEHGGDQLFLDLYPHFFDFVWQLFGAPLWCHAHLTQDGRNATPADLKEGVEGMGLVAGDGIKAYYEFAGGVAVDFESYRGDGKEIPYRIDIHGTEGTLSMPGPMVNNPDIFYHPLVNPGLIGDERWEVVPSEPPPDDQKWLNAHRRMARSMIDGLQGRKPEWDLVGLENARLYLEMAMMAHASHIVGARVSLPLATTANPFDDWK
jgi:predicted dehydrogenase